MRCEEVEELSGAYALYALTPVELAEVERHLAGCDKHPALAGLTSVAAMLGLTAPEMEPPVELRTRLMEAVRAGSGPALAPSAVPRGAILQRLRGIVVTPLAGYGLAAALAVVVVALLIARPGRGNEAVVRSITSGATSGRVVYIPDEHVTVLTVDGLAPASAGKTYQVWDIRGGVPVSIGFLEVSADRRGNSVMRTDISSGEVIAVTIEPEGGSPLPTTDPLFKAGF